MNNIKNLIDEAKKLRKTFTESDKICPGIFTTDKQGISKWITKCMVELEGKGETAKLLYKKFEKWFNQIGSLRLDDFDDLLGALEVFENVDSDEDDSYYKKGFFER